MRRLQMDASQPPKKAVPLPPDGVHSITYCRLWNTGNYENQKLEVTAIVNEGENVSDKVQALRKWVDHELIHRPKQEKKEKNR